MITKEQKEARRKYVGSSDAPAICGVDPYRSAYDVWLEKTGRAGDQPENEAMAAGSLLESTVVQWASKACGINIVGSDIMRTCGPLAANLDAIGEIDNVPGIIEAKTTGMSGWPDRGYGEVTEGPNVELPERVLVQVAHQFAVFPALQVAWVPVLIGTVGFRLYTVQRDKDLVDAVAARGHEFWQQHVESDTPPSDAKPSLDVLKRVRREPATVTDLRDELVDAWIVAKAALKQAKEDADRAEADLLAALGTHEAGTCLAGLVTFYETKRKAYAVAATSYRTLRIKKNKGNDTQTAAIAAEETV